MMLIGLLGGMSWESTALYYREMNETANATRSAACIPRAS
jgi:aspartate/glutamate racemase